MTSKLVIHRLAGERLAGWLSAADFAKRKVAAEQKFADLCGVNLMTARGWLRGYALPRGQSLARASKVTGKSIEWICGDPDAIEQRQEISSQLAHELIDMGGAEVFDLLMLRPGVRDHIIAEAFEARAGR
jgi:hypothetical protein